MPLSLSKLLEQYAFSVTSRYITRIGSEERAELIELVGQLDASASGSIDSEQTDDSSINSSGSCLSELHREWTKALKKPIG